MSSETYFITPEIKMDTVLSYLIRSNGTELFNVDTEHEAKLAIDSIAATETKRLTNEWVKVFKEELNDGKKIILSTQSLGRVFNGVMTQESVIDYIPIGHAVLVKGRHELLDKILNIPVPPPMPDESVLKKITERRNQVISLPSNSASTLDTNTDETGDNNDNDENYEDVYIESEIEEDEYSDYDDSSDDE